MKIPLPLSHPSSPFHLKPTQETQITPLKTPSSLHSPLPHHSPITKHKNSSETLTSRSFGHSFLCIISPTKNPLTPLSPSIHTEDPTEKLLPKKQWPLNSSRNQDPLLSSSLPLNSSKLTKSPLHQSLWSRNTKIKSPSPAVGQAT